MYLPGPREDQSEVDKQSLQHHQSQDLTRLDPGGGVLSLC